MLADAGGGGKSPAKKSKGGGLGAAAGAVGAGKTDTTPDWMREQSKPGGKSSTPVLDILAAAATPKISDPLFDPLKQIQDELGMKTGALTPAADLAKEENPKADPKVDSTWKNHFTPPDLAEGLKPRTVTGQVKAKPLTRETYLDLPAEIRAAVDFNTMVHEARSADRGQRREGSGPEVQRGTTTGTVMGPGGVPLATGPSSTTETLPDGYGDVFEKVFGQRPSRLAAAGGEKMDTPKLAPISPEVLAVLDQIGYATKDPEEMREFLSLRNGISQNDIDNYLKDDEQPTVPQLFPGLGAPLKNDREQFVEKIVGLTTDLQDKLAKGDQLVADFQTSALKAREDGRLTAGADVKPVEVPFGFGDKRQIDTKNLPGFKIDEAFQQTFTHLLQQNDPAEVAATMARFDDFLKTEGLDPESFPAYVAARLDNADRFEQPLGSGKKDDTFEYRTPDEYRELLGLTRKEQG